eukprot:TRINITY_DN5148_c0_g1_i4.p2 TRINITY_DN5148_c0_g1~~TRINITY_DN5148_c0_g1_i4.p2  ORF type:complete len:173 (-),score=28.09 TRINITY_DN5148_c0_g1_i4:297-815(-)
MTDMAAEWWEGMQYAPGSFQKPVFIIGYRGFYRSIVLPYAPIQRSPFDIVVTAQSVSGFWQDGNSLYVKVRVDTPGSYKVIIYYELAEPSRDGTVKIAVGKYSEIIGGTAPYVERRITDTKIGPISLGEMYLEASTEKDKTEMQVQVYDLSSEVLGSFFSYLSEVHFERIER